MHWSRVELDLVRDCSTCEGRTPPADNQADPASQLPVSIRPGGDSSGPTILAAFRSAAPWRATPLSLSSTCPAAGRTRPLSCQSRCGPEISRLCCCRPSPADALAPSTLLRQGGTGGFEDLGFDACTGNTIVAAGRRGKASWALLVPHEPRLAGASTEAPALPTGGSLGQACINEAARGHGCAALRRRPQLPPDL